MTAARKIRAFIACELDEPALLFAREAQNTMRHCGADIKWIPGERMHITLKFLGNINIAGLGNIKKTLNEITLNTPPLQLCLENTNALPNNDRPRVICLKIADKSGNLAKLRETMEQRLLLSHGIPAETRAYRPHLTLGRVRSAGDTNKLSGILNADVFTAKHYFQAKEVALFSSTLTSRGPVYEKAWSRAL